MTTPALVLAAARARLGVPWVHMGRSRFSLDCVGLVVVSFAAAGCSFAYPDPPYGPLAGPTSMVDACEAWLGRVGQGFARDQGRPADILLFGPPAAHAVHVGFLADAPRPGYWHLLHTFRTAGKVVEHRLDPRWQGLVKGHYRAPEFA